MVSMGSLGSSPLCEQSQDWARQASCSRSHNKGRTRPASLPGQSGKAQASGQGERPGAQDPQSWECPPRHHFPVRDGEAFPQVTQPLTVTFKPCRMLGLLCSPREGGMGYKFPQAFLEACHGPCPGAKGFCHPVRLCFTLRRDYSKWRWKNRALE